MKTNVHVQLGNTRIKRRVILESTKSFTEQLQTYKVLKKLRKEKNAYLLHLRELIKEIHKSLSQIRMRDMDYHTPHIKHEITKEEIKPQEPKLSKEEDRLSKDLADIERKLTSL